MEISLAAEKIAHLGPIPITNSMVTSWVASILLITLSFFATRNLKLIPKGIQNTFELVIEFLIGTIDSVIGNREQTKRYFPLLATIFLFIIANNWFGLLPGIGTIGLREEHLGKSIFVPIFRAGNADLNTTLALAIIAVIMIQVFGIIAIGGFKYASKFLNFKSPIMFFVGILEFISELSRIISYSFRLFGNIFAGEVLLAVISMLFAFVLPLPFMGLEIFVGFIQALVFTMLTIVFIKMATLDHAEEH